MTSCGALHQRLTRCVVESTRGSPLLLKTAIFPDVLLTASAVPSSCATVWRLQFGA
jgi:hypothetical protein